MKIIGLVDCNNFFVSCERVFNPKLVGRPTLVLSGNDGCVIARSQEAKDLGVLMGIPVFKIKHLIDKKNIKLNSTNFELYRDMSARIMNIIREQIDTVEVYSIDEAFFDLTRYKDPVKKAQELSQTITQYTGIPVSIGIASTKTLAKLANKIAKKNGKVFYISSESERVWALKQTDIGDVWGIGQKISQDLRRRQIYNAFDFQLQEDSWLQKRFSIKGLGVAKELREEMIYDFQEKPNRRKSIVSSKSFRKGVISPVVLASSLIEHIENAAFQLRTEKSVAKKLTIYISTGLYQKQGNYKGEETVVFDDATDDTAKLVKQVNLVLQKIFRRGLVYKKTGVCLSGIISNEQNYKTDLFGTNINENNIIDKTVDNLNNRFGTNTIQVASSCLFKNDRKNIADEEKLQLKSPRRSNRYTTQACEIPRIN